MKRWLTQVGKRGLCVAGILAVVGVAIAYLIRRLIDGPDAAGDDLSILLRFGMAFGAFGFVVLVVLEVLNATLNLIRGKKPSPPADDAVTFPWPSENSP